MNALLDGYYVKVCHRASTTTYQTHNPHDDVVDPFNRSSTKAIQTTSTLYSGGVIVIVVAAIVVSITV